MAPASEPGELKLWSSVLRSVGKERFWRGMVAVSARSVSSQEQHFGGFVGSASLGPHHSRAGAPLEDPGAAAGQQPAVWVPALSLFAGGAVCSVHQHLQDGVVVPVQSSSCLYLTGKNEPSFTRTCSFVPATVTVHPSPFQSWYSALVYY